MAMPYPVEITGGQNFGERQGIGFELPPQTPSIVPNVPKSGFAGEVEVAVNYSEVS